MVLCYFSAFPTSLKIEILDVRVASANILFFFLKLKISEIVSLKGFGWIQAFLPYLPPPPLYARAEQTNIMD